MVRGLGVRDSCGTKSPQFFFNQADHRKMAIILEEPTLFENVLYYGLLLGAFFQIACIAAVIFIPQSENEEVCC